MADSLRSLVRFLRAVGAGAALVAGFVLPLGAQVTGSPEPQVVAIRWPKLQSLPAIDKEVRVGLQMAPALGAKNLTGYSLRVPHHPRGGRPHIDYFFYSEPRHPAVADEPATLSEVIVVDLAHGLETRLRDVVHTLFPSSNASPPAAGADVDLLLRAGMDTRWQQDADGNVVGIEVHLQLGVLSPAGEHLETLRTYAFARPEERSFLSNATRWRSVGLQALTTAIDQLTDQLRGSPAFATAIAKAAAARALPAGLETQLEFDDREALLPNGRLDAGEEAFVHVRLINHGPGLATGITLKAIPEGVPAVSVPAPQTLGTLAPQAWRELTLAIVGGLDLPAGTLHLRVETKEKRGFDGRAVTVPIATAPLLRPSLEIVDVAWNDRDGRGQGDGDGQPSNGETLEAVVRVRNAGPGDAAGVVVSIGAPPLGVELVEPRATLRRIPADEVGEARVVVRLPMTYAAAELGLAFDAVDGRGPQAGSAHHALAWPVRVKRPAVALAHRFYDGSSPSSVGNRDGRVNNGERIELVLTATNRGELPARDLRVAVATGDRKLVASPSTLAVGNLPAQNEGVEQRLLLDVPRAFGAANATELPLTLKLSQLEFPPQEVTISLPFHQLRPDFAVEPASPAAIAGGKSGSVTWQLHNPGELQAEDVVVEVTAPAGGVELLDDHGVPTAKRRFTIGSLAAGAGARFSLPLLAKQGAAVGAHPLSVAILQRDFPSAAREVHVEVTGADGPAVTRARAGIAPLAGIPETAGAAPATISFLRFANGDQVSAATVLFGFDVRSATEPLTVRAMQNGRELRLEGKRHELEAEGGRQRARYELLVDLAPGDNRFEVVVITRGGLVSKDTLSLAREWQKGRMWVVAIGVDRYRDPKIDALRFPVADASAVYDYFGRAFHVPESQLFLLIDEHATLRAIKSLLGTQLARLANNPEDTVVLYFAGHGLAEGGAGSIDADQLSKYLLPYDAERDDLYSTALDVDEVTNIVRRLIPDRVVVIIDSCFSGAAGGRSPFDPRERPRGVVTAEFLDRMVAAAKGRVVLTASGANEVAGERTDLGHGIFTYYLLSGLGGDADADRNGEVDVDELYRFVSDRVTAATNGKQNPVKRAPQSVGSIVLGRAAVPSASATP